MVPEEGVETSVSKKSMPAGYPVRTRGIHWQRNIAARFFPGTRSLLHLGERWCFAILIPDMKFCWVDKVEG